LSIIGFDIHDAFPASGPWYQARWDEGYRFGIIKASGGYGFRNAKAAQQAASSRKVGLKVGWYHFMFEPDSVQHGGEDWQREAENFIAAVEAAGGQPGDTLWLDVEAWGQTVGFRGYVGDWVVSFCDHVGAHFNTVCGVYCATWYLLPAGMQGDKRLTKYPLWFASWQDAVPGGAYLAPWDHMTVWQYNADGLDKDRFFGTTEDWEAMGIKVKQDVTGNEVRVGILDDNRPYVQVIFAGATMHVDGADVADLGISVESLTEPGVILDQSVQGNTFKGWRVRQ
jgi:hypothetical protein